MSLEQYLGIAGIIALLAACTGYVIAGERYRRRTMAAPPPPESVTARATVARHRAGAVNEVARDHTPLPAWERLQLAPTLNDPDVFVPQADEQELTRGLVAPRRNHPMGGTR